MDQFKGIAFETRFCMRAERWAIKGSASFQFLYIDEKGQETALTDY